ncbi:hypothetical protein RIF29_08264 [Crotalaria pallida]|uniref:Uncharacterized protein n=1 Tax=Crotalaria pallida TaxID=3830 RepID=A0AAN9J6Z1_CROPI
MLERIILEPEKETTDDTDQIKCTDMVLLEQNQPAKSETPLFGPWMMVQRQQKSRNKSGYRKQEMLVHTKNVSTRFDALADLKEDDNPNIDETNPYVDTTNANTKDKGPTPMQKSLIKVRNRLAGRNPQSKGAKSSQDPSSSKKGFTKSSPVSTKSQQQQKTFSKDMGIGPMSTEDTKSAVKEKEKQILHHMRTLVNFGFNSLDNFITRVSIPD